MIEKLIYNYKVNKYFYYLFEILLKNRYSNYFKKRAIEAYHSNNYKR